MTSSECMALALLLSVCLMGLGWCRCRTQVGKCAVNRIGISGRRTPPGRVGLHSCGCLVPSGGCINRASPPHRRL